MHTNLIILLVVLAFVFFGGGNYYGNGQYRSYGFGLGGILLFILVLVLLGLIHI
jgi:hypothetical protein